MYTNIHHILQPYFISLDLSHFLSLLSILFEKNYHFKLASNVNEIQWNHQYERIQHNDVIFVRFRFYYGIVRLPFSKPCSCMKYLYIFMHFERSWYRCGCCCWCFIVHDHSLNFINVVVVVVVICLNCIISEYKPRKIGTALQNSNEEIKTYCIVFKN